jgi:hypothetical protein
MLEIIEIKVRKSNRFIMSLHWVITSGFDQRSDLAMAIDQARAAKCGIGRLRTATLSCELLE